MSAKLRCQEVWHEISSYLDGSLEASLRQQMERHLANCEHCQAVLDGTANLAELVADPRALNLSEDQSRRLYSKLNRHLHGQHTHAQAINIPSGITDDRVALGSHMIYFWADDAGFERGVRFLYPGLGQGEHCIAFGHDEALEKVLGVLDSGGFCSDELIRRRELTLLRRQVSAERTLSDISDVVLAALRTGATAVRFLGNLGMGRDPLPAGEDDVLELESKATKLISQMPCVIVCMYDMRTVSGRLILKGGLETHHLAVCPQGICENPYFVPDFGASTH